jgi:hypothetical protein
MRRQFDEEAWFRLTGNDPAQDQNYWNYQKYMLMASLGPIVHAPVDSPQAMLAQSPSPATAE